MPTWGTIEEAGVTPATTRLPRQLRWPWMNWLSPLPVDASHAESFPTGVSEFDRVLGSGLVPGAVILLAGEPGIGKSRWPWISPDMLPQPEPPKATAQNTVSDR